MDQISPRARKPRKEKTDLDSRVFRDGQIYLFRRADYKKPIWYCRVKVPGAKGYVTASTKTTSEHEAFKFADDLFHTSLGRVATGQDINSKRAVVALKEYIEYSQLHDKENLSKKIKLSLLRRWLDFFGNKRLKEINTATIIELNQWTSERSMEQQREEAEKRLLAYEEKLKYYQFKKERKNSRPPAKPEVKEIKPFSLNTIKRISNYQRMFFNWCVDRSYLDVSPRFPVMKTDPNRRPHFNSEDYNKLTRHLREFIKHENTKTIRDRIMLTNYVLILANTGIRVGEARGLKWRDLREIPQTKRSNNPPDIALYVRGKTGAREVVARTPDVKEYFQRILELRTEELLAEKKKVKDDDYVFCNRDGTPIGSFKTSFNALIKSAGVEFDSNGDRRTIYSLRHTYATFRLQEGVHQYILAKNMGTSTEMLEKHYGHTSNVASAAELTKGGNFKNDKKAKAIDWLRADNMPIRDLKDKQKRPNKKVTKPKTKRVITQ